MQEFQIPVDTVRRRQPLQQVSEQSYTHSLECTLARMVREAVVSAGTRQERKQRTRQSLLDAALRLLADRSLASLSLREVARAVGIVPTAFYRHFASMDDLGVALVEESMRTLRTMIREVRTQQATEAIRGTVAVLARQVRAREAHFRFLVRERYGGTPAVRRAIGLELRLIASELAVDLGRFPGMEKCTADDLRMAADLMVGAMLNIVLALLEVDPHHAEDEQQVAIIAEKQLRLIALGLSRWESS
jgi:TetR/AcrR family transcriptional regulator, fatty acid biosynthesis regulator